MAVDAFRPYRADWRSGRVTSWLTATDHKRIGILYVRTALVFFALGGLLALLIRTQLAVPGAHVMTRSSYNQAVTIHGTTMVFLVAVPLLIGLANYLVPLQIGAQGMAFPRLNALSYWLYLLGGVTLYCGFLAKGGAAASGWTAEVPLSTLHSPGRGQDLWIIGLLVFSAGSFAAGVNLAVTIANMRTAGMSWLRVPLFTWTAGAYAWVLVVSMPVLAAGLSMMLLDRRAGTHFFDPRHGGSVLLYQHLFWFAGQPIVYAAILPAMGMVSEIVPVFARKPIFGYRTIVFATVAIAILTFTAWAEHMFASGLSAGASSLFMITSMAVAVPAGVKIFNWLATLWRGNISFDTPMLWALGFISVFTVGGLSGLFLAAYPVDRELGGTYFVVAHLHYVLFGGAVFAILGGLHYWWPKIFGRLLDERLGAIHFWLVFLGFNVAFFPQFLLGLLGMPRQVYTYHAHGLWEGYNMISTIGSYAMALGMLVFVANVIKTSRSVPRADNDPWVADTLEWYTTSPPPPANFESVPYVTSARPVRDLRRLLAEEGRL